MNTGEQWFELAPADEAGKYEVDLVGQGPEGNVASQFVWTTTTDGPIDPPVGAVGLFPQSGSGGSSYVLELSVDDLPFIPIASEVPSVVDVDVTSADGAKRTLTAPLERSTLECGDRGARGSFYYQAEWNEDISTLGESSLLMKTKLRIRGTTHLGRATWRGARSAMPVMEFDPPLPDTDAD